MKWLEHFKTINKHKMCVMKHCFAVGLYKQGLLHDLSKYSWTEFSMGAKYYQGNRSPNDAEREDKGYTSSWLHHKGRNKHHLEYWIDYSVDKSKGLVGMPMPKQYVIEMFCDRMAACKTYNKDAYTERNPLDYYMKGRASKLLHPESRALLEKYLNMLATKGEKYTFKYIKNKEVIPMRREKIKKLFKMF
ncbi:MAG: DUF5662 family protein [Lachnospiraceae bacterium]|nr:DUF5662 family protein [Lachnospiraceae bacterium]